MMHMQTMPFKDIRKDFTDIAAKVQHLKDCFLLTKNNKPSVGLVPPEMLLLLVDIVNLSKENEEVAKLIEPYAIFLSEEDFDLIESRIEKPQQLNSRLKASLRAAERKFTD